MAIDPIREIIIRAQADPAVLRVSATADQERRLKRVEGQMVTAWLPLAYVNGWTDFGGGHQPGEYRLNKYTRTCELRGLLTRSPATWVVPQVIATLPIACRPDSIHLFGPIGSSTGPVATCRVDVDTAGNITLVNGLTNPLAYLTLAGITFAL